MYVNIFFTVWLEEEVVKEFENIEKKLGKINWRNDIFKASDYVEK